MSTPFIRTALATGVAGALIAAPPALARGPVFGGSTSDDEAIVLRTDAKAKKLKSAVIAWTARCDDGRIFTYSNEIAVQKTRTGVTLGGGGLLVTRNGGGRFSGTALDTQIGDSLSAGIVVKLSGRMTPKRATGTLAANVIFLDQQGNQQGSCDTPTLKWSASRSPGRVFAGKTSQAEPVVVRLDAKRRKVSDVMIGWASEQCQPPGFMSFGEHFTDFPIANRRFGDSFSQDFDLDDGSKRTFAYELAGTLSRSDVRGSLHVTVKQVDTSGSQTFGCDSNAISWKALTG
jgi:hypothetical protein